MTSAVAPSNLAAFRKRAERFLNQECWLWGEDVKRSNGNLLCEYGFKREPVDSYSTRYFLTTGAGARIALWGFGVAYASGDDDAIFLGRFAFVPRLTSCDSLARAMTFEDLALRYASDAKEIARAARQVAPLLRWIGDYEAWVVQVAGAEYRTGCLERWEKRRSTLEEALVVWPALANECEAIGHDELIRR